MWPLARGRAKDDISPPRRRTGNSSGAFWRGRGPSSESYRPWRWNDLYRELGKAAREAIKGQLDPPDHALVVAHVVRALIKEADEKRVSLPPGVRRGVGFKAPPVAPSPGAPAGGRDVGRFGPGPKCPVFPHPPCGTPRPSRRNPLSPVSGLHRLACGPRPGGQRRRSPPWPPTSKRAPVRARGRRFVLVGFLSFTSAQLRLVRALGSGRKHCAGQARSGHRRLLRRGGAARSLDPEKRGEPGGVCHLLERGPPCWNPKWWPGSSLPRLRVALASRLSRPSRPLPPPWPGFGGVVGGGLSGGPSPAGRGSSGRYRVPWNFRGAFPPQRPFGHPTPPDLRARRPGGWGWRGDHPGAGAPPPGRRGTPAGAGRKGTPLGGARRGGPPRRPGRGQKL